MALTQHEKVHRRALYDWCSSEYPSAVRGTPYPCEQGDLDECAHVPKGSPYSARLPKDVTLDLESFLDPYTSFDPTVQAAIVRLRTGLKINDWKPDIVLKAFYDLDIVFFNGKLRGQTTVTWRCVPWWNERYGHRDGYRVAQGQAEYLGHGKAAIYLNAWGVFLDPSILDPKVLMWQVLLHEMVHAYEYVMCRGSPAIRYDDSRGWDDGHGLVFRRLIRPVNARAMRYLGIPAIRADEYRGRKYAI